MKRPFNKPATTHAPQVALLQTRGMAIDDVASAEFYLQHLNHYRLVAYWLPFEADHATHTFHPGTTFNAVLNLYTFDRELRLLVMDAIERIEVSVRSQWAYQMARIHGPHAHLDSGIHDRRYWHELVRKTGEEVTRTEDETFVKHFLTHYDESLPPVWATCEILSLGLLSRWYSILGPMNTRRAIARPYDVDEQVLESWLHHLALVRNLCAHHGRLWNRDFAVIPIRPRSKPATLPGEFMTGSRKLYNTLLILVHFLDVVSPGHHGRRRFKDLIAKHAAPVARMGFPVDWLDRPIWHETTP